MSTLFRQLFSVGILCGRRHDFFTQGLIGGNSFIRVRYREFVMRSFSCDGMIGSSFPCSIPQFMVGC